MKKRKETILQFEAVFEPNGGGYTVTVPKLPGVVTEGNTLHEARTMAKDAILCYLGAVLKDDILISRQLKKKEKIKVTV